MAVAQAFSMFVNAVLAAAAAAAQIHCIVCPSVHSCNCHIVIFAESCQTSLRTAELQCHGQHAELVP